MIRIAVFALALAASDAVAAVPLSIAESGQLTAPVRVGGGAPTAFVIDTGAPGCAVSERFATSRRLLKVGGVTRPTQVLAPGVVIDGMDIGALTCTLLPDTSRVDGVIGADALSRFVVSFDETRMTLSLHGGAQHGQALVSPRARLVDATRLPGGLLGVPVRLNSVVGIGVLGTGARRSTFNPRFADAAGVAPEAQADRLGAFALAGTVTPDIRARVADAPAFKASGTADRPAMVLGLDRLQGMRLIIDYPRRRVWFDPG